MTDENMRVPAEDIAQMLEATPAEPGDDAPVTYVVRIDGRRMGFISGMEEGFDGGFIECETIALARRLARCVDGTTNGRANFTARIEVKS